MVWRHGGGRMGGKMKCWRGWFGIEDQQPGGWRLGAWNGGLALPPHGGGTSGLSALEPSVRRTSPLGAVSICE